MNISYLYLNFLPEAHLPLRKFSNTRYAIKKSLYSVKEQLDKYFTCAYVDTL